MGRHRKPAEEQAIKGNPGHRPIAIAPTEILPVVDSLAAPKFMTPKAKKVWARVAPELIAANILRESDVESFAQYCELVAVFWDAASKMKRGALIDGKPNPAWKIMREAQLNARSMAAQFGMTPAARVAIFEHFARKGGVNPGALPKTEAEERDTSKPRVADAIGALN